MLVPTGSLLSGSRNCILLLPTVPRAYSHSLAAFYKTPQWIKMWYAYMMEYFSAIKRNKTGLFTVMWMNLESVIQSQKDKNKYCILMHVYEI